MNRPHFLVCLQLLALAGLLGLATAASAGSIYQPAGLSAGDEYRLVFVTANRRDALSADIEDYNDFVTADAHAPGSVVADLDTEWKAIASSRTVDAIDNTGTDPSFLGPTGVPIYLIDGTTRLADNYDDLWDGTIPSIIHTTPVPATVLEFIWTGTGADGKALAPLGGADEVGYGLITTFDAGWIAYDALVLPEMETSLYAISGVLTAVPEPTAGVLAIGWMAAVTAVRRR